MGRRFRRVFDAAILKIQETPERWRVVERDVRRYLVRGFLSLVAKINDHACDAFR